MLDEWWIAMKFIYVSKVYSRMVLTISYQDKSGLSNESPRFWADRAEKFRKMQLFRLFWQDYSRIITWWDEST